MSFDMQPIDSESGNHKEQGYDRANQVLRVRYGNDQIWDYHGVTPELYQAALEAPSFGSYLRRIIEPGAPARPITEEEHASTAR
jgi:hypothetical protein